ncbi:biotin--[acetyl-CoA-carboxylase] ligase [Lutibaculum baratangense]|uniref:biotin--[biotin carboxyl-carrier protein] ligase n=1 Tax=Lutibaculum baratangense AMV1 TaxID=631454 RepID=V4RG52_9HYPH|nr:biotin--[acetyl-CoA-carboxylase] ligase [Lutibaculum baratangense]ESR25126.1 Biotin-protein ligase [Lutibaculum baratangense AMV1]
MAFVLSDRARHSGYRLHAYESVGSTNSEALLAAKAGDPGRLWVVSSEQTAGRGRRSSVWSTSRGNLAASCLMVMREPGPRLATLGFVAGLALHDALAEVAPDLIVAAALDGAAGIAGKSSVRFSLKWPNDVLADGAKLSGILLETVSIGSATGLVAGIGVNVVSAPERLAYPTASLRSLGASCSAETVFEALSDRWCRYEELWDEGRGLAAIRSAWLDRAAGLGQPVAVAVGSEVTRGVFETIDEECRLVLRTDAGSRLHVSAGEVHFGTVASHRGAG